MRVFDVIVVGGGHAGTEAAAAAARMGARTALITHKRCRLGEMSCNPAIGGLGKGHLVREIDALDGIMGDAADRAGIQFRLLNRSKGPAVRGPRTQADRVLYRAAIQEVLAGMDALTIIEDSVEDIALCDKHVSAVIGAKATYRTGAAILATGTFLNGMIHRGTTRIAAGRLGDKPAIALSRRLQSLGLRMARLKTGTPPRLSRESIDWSGLEQQYADDTPSFFSLKTEAAYQDQISCAITWTNPRAHAVIASNIEQSAAYSGAVTQKGPRYCPSIEDKITRFAGRERHQIFLEPEGLTSDVIYPNGISTSLPEAVQTDFIHAIAGLEKARITQFGYVIAYDHVDPRELRPDYSLRACRGLYLAGQINGTTGYEEAAAQGLIAGLNAAMAACGSTRTVTPGRTDSYIGVMTDDLITRGVNEPYRMFTSRAEYRLSLRADNADIRLTPLGIEIGCVSKQRRDMFKKWQTAISEATQRLSALSLNDAQAEHIGITPARDGRRRTALDALSLSGIDMTVLARIWPEFGSLPEKLCAHLRAEALYRHYLPRQDADMRALRKDDAVAIPPDTDYAGMAGLSLEAQEKLTRAGPASLGQAARLEGVTHGAMTVLRAHLKRRLARHA